jgi:hypothetical protein
MNIINFTEVDFSSLSNLVVVASDDQISRDLDGEAVILNMKSGVYCGLNEVGARIWQLIQEPMSVGHIRDILLEEYQVESDLCKKDLLALLQKLTDHGLIEIKNGKNT